MNENNNFSELEKGINDLNTGNVQSFSSINDLMKDLNSEKYTVEIFQDLIDILESDSKEQLNCYVQMNRLFINGYNSESDLMLRYRSDSVLTIARLVVETPRAGVGSDVLNWLTDFAKRENFKTIEMESVLSDSMENFCIKHQFVREDKWEDSFQSLNWFKSIE